MPDQSAGLEVRSLGKSYGRETVLQAVSFTLKPGEALGVGGSNGTGKTTLIHLLASVLPPDEGTVTLFGISSKAGKAYRRHIGFVPQDIALSPRLTVAQNLDFWASVRGLSGEKRKAAVAEAARLAQVGDFMDKRVDRCSGGMARRANLAAGLVGDPSLILLDEPTAGIDEKNREPILRSIQDLLSIGRMVVMVNHYREELEAVCASVITLPGAASHVKGQA